MGVLMLILQLIPVRKTGLIIQGFSYIIFATDIQLIPVRKIVTLITERASEHVISVINALWAK